jgi:hypothetical protein
VVFGNGIRFVWRGGVSEELQVAEAALVDAVEAGFIAVQESEAVGIGGVLEGGGEEAGAVTGVGDVEALGKQLGFDGPGTAHAPEGGHHFFDDAVLDAVGGLEAIQVFGEDFRKTLGRFVVQDDAASQQGVAAGVLG